MHVFRMTSLSYTEARESLATIWDKAESEREPIEITRRGHESMMLIPAGELAGLLETAHLLRSPANAKRLMESLAELRSGKGKEVSIEDLWRMVK